MRCSALRNANCLRALYRGLVPLKRETYCAQNAHGVSVLDAICYDFWSVIVSDCSAAVSETMHNDTINLYTKTVLHPLLKVSTSGELLSDLGVD